MLDIAQIKALDDALSTGMISGKRIMVPMDRTL